MGHVLKAEEGLHLSERGLIPRRSTIADSSNWQDAGL